jgi:acylphosphatase
MTVRKDRAESGKKERMQLVARVHGRVQGVGFRFYTRGQASRMGLTGWVRNERDGSVSVVCEGPEETVKKFHTWLQTGPPAAHVTAVDARYREADGGFSSFTVE